MRTIGKRNIKLLNSIMREVIQEVNTQQFGWVTEFKDKVIERLPNKIFETWESAYSEIENLIEEFAEQYSETSPEVIISLSKEERRAKCKRQQNR